MEIGQNFQGILFGNSLTFRSVFMITYTILLSLVLLQM